MHRREMALLVAAFLCLGTVVISHTAFASGAAELPPVGSGAAAYVSVGADKGPWLVSIYPFDNVSPNYAVSEGQQLAGGISKITAVTDFTGIPVAIALDSSHQFWYTPLESCATGVCWDGGWIPTHKQVIGDGGWTPVSDITAVLQSQGSQPLRVRREQRFLPDRAVAHVGKRRRLDRRRLGYDVWRLNVDESARDTAAHATGRSDEQRRSRRLRSPRRNIPIQAQRREQLVLWMELMGRLVPRKRGSQRVHHLLGRGGCRLHGDSRSRTEADGHRAATGTVQQNINGTSTWQTMGAPLGTPGGSPMFTQDANLGAYVSSSTTDSGIKTNWADRTSWKYPIGPLPMVGEVTQLSSTGEGWLFVDVPADNVPISDGGTGYMFVGNPQLTSGVMAVNVNQGYIITNIRVPFPPDGGPNPQFNPTYSSMTGILSAGAV